MRGSGRGRGTTAVPDITASNRNCDIDLSLQNIVIRNDDFVIYDYEWLAGNISAQYCFLRSMSSAYNTWPHEMQQEMPLQEIARAAGATDEQIKQYNRAEKKFINLISDYYPYEHYAKKMVPLQ